MSIESDRGSEWRRWDLHLHTKDTNKNDQFNESADFDAYCVTMLKKAVDKNIAAIGITDYFSIDNYKRVVEFISNIDSRTDFDADQKRSIKNILVVPNVELRMLPVTARGSLVNIHCIFNPAIVSKLDNKFFASIECSDGSTTHKMNLQGLIDFGKSFDSGLDEKAAYKKGVDNFHVDQAKLQELLTDEVFAENTIVVVSNSTNDGASGFQKHYDSFEDIDPGSLEGVRKAIYSISQAIFSSNEGDRKYFLGLSKDDEDVVKKKCGSLKPCIHGSDAHTESKLFEPDEDRFCWIKADTTFEGLKQIIYEPADRVFIGLEPPVLDRVRTNKTKYIDMLNINHLPGYSGAQGVWFKDVSINLNKELIAIIGNKGSGKSALSDILGVLGNTHNAGANHENLSFLRGGKKLKFRKKGYAENFEAELVWEDGSGADTKIPLDHNVDPDDTEKVKYLPQNYFENLTNDLEGEGFDKTLKSVIFLHIPEEQRLGAHSFEELEDKKAKSIEADLVVLRDEAHSISEETIKLEAKKHPSRKKQIENAILEKKNELTEHEKIKPVEIPDPAKQGDEEAAEAKSEKYDQLEKLNATQAGVLGKIAQKRTELNGLTQDQEELTQLKNALSRVSNQAETFKIENATVFEKHGLIIDEIIEIKVKNDPILLKIQEKQESVNSAKAALRTKSAIDTDPELIGKPAELKAAYAASLQVQEEDIRTQITEIKKDLSRPEKEFQEYKEKLKKWGDRKREIEGSKNQINSLKFYEEELRYITKELTSTLNTMRGERLKKTISIFKKQKEIVELYRIFKESIDKEISKDEEFSKKFKMIIDVNFKLDPLFMRSFLQFINKSKRGTFYGSNENHVSELFSEMDLLDESHISQILNTTIEWLELNQKESNEDLRPQEISDQIDKLQEFYDFLFYLEYLKPVYELKLDGKILDELSPGEKGTLLLVFYLMIDKEDTPLIIDQPEDNLDNKSVFQVLTHFIKTAKKRRQIIIVTHNPNLAVGADAEQIIYVELDKKSNKNTFTFEVGAIENPRINKQLVEILEGTMPAFNRRKLRYNKS
ncbi:MAG: TrlF family AAA-like ATPase [Candidatus Saccharimonadales bacterium]